MKGRTVPAYCAVPVPVTTCVWLARLKIKLGRNPNGLWNATLPVEFTCTIGFVIINVAVMEVEEVVDVPVVVPPDAGVAVGPDGFMVSVPVQSAFTV
jgi:hypothetical protein